MTDPIVHFELTGPDEGPLHAFYREVFGWTVNPMGPGYALVETPGGSPNGAVREGEAAGLTIGVGVRDLAEAIARATERGGTVVMEPMDNGFVSKALIADPAGNVLSLIQDDG